MNDEQLQRRFAALREQEAHAAPGFERSWARANREALERKPRLWLAVRLALAGSVTAYAAGAALMFWMARSDSDGPAPASWEAQLASIEHELTALEFRTWQAPSDFLLTANP